MAEGPHTLILDCDGVLADTERDGHRVAFNRMFAEVGLPVHWSVRDYPAWLRIGGGKERLTALLTDEFVTRAGLPTDADRQSELIKRWHRRKSELYTELVKAGHLQPRPGVRRLISAANAAGWTVAVASTSAAASVTAVLELAVGERLAREVPVFAGDAVPAKKPAPDIYRLAVDSLGAVPNSTVVIEDSRNGLLAAHRAGLRCVVTVSSQTADEDFSEATLVVSDLGDPGRDPITVIADPTSIAPGDAITLDDLEAVNLSRRAR